MRSAYNSKYRCQELIKKYYHNIPLWSELLDKEIKNYLPAEYVLDAGCGKDARYISKYLDLITQPFGVDLEDINANPKIKTYKCDIESLPFKDNFFDLIIARVL